MTMACLPKSETPRKACSAVSEIRACGRHWQILTGAIPTQSVADAAVEEVTSVVSAVEPACPRNRMTPSTATSTVAPPCIERARAVLWPGVESEMMQSSRGLTMLASSSAPSARRQRSARKTATPRAALTSRSPLIRSQTASAGSPTANPKPCAAASGASSPRTPRKSMNAASAAPTRNEGEVADQVVWDFFTFDSIAMCGTKYRTCEMKTPHRFDESCIAYASQSAAPDDAKEASVPNTAAAPRRARAGETRG
jgi:hypothetical protein